jgi:mannose-6-phosphate isomerase-like protein (cupin superfamily)
MAAKASSGRLYEELLRSGRLSAGIYELAAGSEDPQQPHGEDEVYVVLLGQAKATIGDETVPVSPGTLLYVPARIPHWFHEIEEDLLLVVVFAPPEGTAGTVTATDRPRSSTPSP